jgi:hypothetical protein
VGGGGAGAQPRFPPLTVFAPMARLPPFSFHYILLLNYLIIKVATIYILQACRPILTKRFDQYETNLELKLETNNPLSKSSKMAAMR